MPNYYIMDFTGQTFNYKIYTKLYLYEFTRTNKLNYYTTTIYEGNNRKHY